MASFFCHVVAGTKRFRLERIVSPYLLEAKGALTDAKKCPAVSRALSELRENSAAAERTTCSCPNRERCGKECNSHEHFTELHLTSPDSHGDVADTEITPLIKCDQVVSRQAASLRSLTKGQPGLRDCVVGANA